MKRKSLTGNDYFGNMGNMMTEDQIRAVNAAIRKACRYTLPYNSIREDAEGGTQVVSDIVQEVWVKVLETGNLDGRTFAIQAKNVIRDWMRREFPMMPVSQMTLQAADAEDEDSELLMPWDRVVWGAPAEFVKMLENEAADKKDAERAMVQEAIKELRQADRRFLLGYLGKKRVHSPAQRMRFQRLTKKMKQSIKRKKLLS